MTQDEIIEMWKNSGDLEIIGMPYSKIEAFAKLVAEAAASKEREAIADQYWSCVQSDLENGVKSLNQKATENFYRSMPELSKFGRWLEARGEA